MKTISALLLIFILISCKAQNEIYSTQNCPSNGVCSSELIQNKSLKIENDHFERLNAKIEEGDKTIFKFVYNRNVDEQYVDGNYTEIIYAELDKDLTEFNLNDSELKNVKLLFNRLCFCKGSTGFYKVTKGILSIKKISKETYNIQLNFKVDEVPQIITSISETVILK